MQELASQNAQGTTIGTQPGVAVPPPAPPESTEGGNGKTPEPTKPAPEKTTSAAFAALAKKEKGLLLKLQDIQAKEKAIAEREAKVADFEKRKSEAKLNPLEALKELGLEYEDVTSFILNKEKPTTDAKLEALREELRSFRSQAEAERRALEEEKQKAATERSQQTIQEFQNQIVTFIEANKEDLDLVHLFGAVGAVYQGIEDVYKQTGRIPTIKEAAQGVQKFLEQKLDELIPKTKWFQAKYGKPAEPVTTPDGSVVQTQTITNAMTPSMGTNLPAQTEKERIARAIAAMEKHLG